MRVVYLHGNNSFHWDYSWARLLKSMLDEMAVESFFETFPDSIIAREQYWIPFLRDHVKVGRDDVLVGRSTGAVAAMRFAEKHAVGGSVLIAPRSSDLGDPQEQASGYFDRPWNWDAIRENQRAIHVISAADDPYIPQAEFRLIADELSAEWTRLQHGGHLGDVEVFPFVADAVRSCIDVLRKSW